MNFYLDDNCAKLTLASLLRRAGHTVTLPGDIGLSGATDARHLAACVVADRILMTRDHDDFLDLHDLILAAQGRHFGILVIRADNDPGRDMKDRDVLRAIANLEAAGVSIASGFHILNHWR